MMFGVRLAVIGALTLAGGNVANGACSSSDPLTYVELAAPSAKCSDGTQAGYFIDEPAGPAEGFLIWLGDSELCKDKADCDLFCSNPEDSLCEGGKPLDDSNVNSTNVGCYFNELRCGSGLYSTLDLTPETVMCEDADAPFRNYIRVFVPQCSLDWWLGRGTAEPSLPNHFKGADIVDALIADLTATKSLGGSGALSKIVLGGTRGGGVGALNHISTFKASLGVGGKVFTVLDSSFFVNMRQFGSKDYSEQSQTFRFDNSLRENSEKWLNTSVINNDCRLATEASDTVYRCLYPSSVLSQESMQDEDVMIVQSQFDLLMMDELGITAEFKVGGEGADFIDDFAYSQTLLSFVQGFGVAQRDGFNFGAEASFDVDTASSSHFYFSPACGQHGYVVPTSLHVIDKTTESVGEVGKIGFKRTGSEWFSVITLDGANLRDSLKSWAVDEAGTIPGTAPSSTVKRNLRVDACDQFNCNPTCVTEISGFELQPLTTECESTMVVVYIFVLVGLFWFIFLSTLLRICMFDLKCKMFWRGKRKDDHIDGREVEKAVMEEAKQFRGRSIQIMVENLNYWSPPKKKGLPPYQILKNVSLNFTAGKVHALMGPSGSGKSTLLDVVSYTRENGTMTGTHSINGVPSHLARASFLREWLRNSTSYVRQQDVLFPYLTVREHLQHAAWLMLPQFMGGNNKLQRVWQVIKLLELGKCADTICGDGGVRVEGGISGGQRRRVSVATQLLKMPAALLLDEPTSGLDSTNALVLVECLKNLANNTGVTVVMTIHQPRSEIFTILDTVSILVKGRVIFHGNPVEASEHFNASLSDVNVGDSILDQLQTSTESTVENYRSKYEKGHLGQRVREEIQSEKTDLTNKMASSLRAVLIENALAEGRWSWSDATSTITTMWVLVSRTIKRGGFDIVRTVTFSAVGGLLVGLVFTKEPNYTSQTALGYLAVSTMTFLQSTFLGDRYNAEKQMWSHERDNGTKVSWVAFLISLFSRNVVSSCLEGLAFAIPIFFLGQMNYTPEIFLNYVLLMVLTSLAVIVQNTTVEIDRIRRGGDNAPDTRQAVIINMSLLALSALFNGFIINLRDLPVWASWIPYTMLSYWGFVGVLVNNFAGQAFECEFDDVLKCAQSSGDNWIRSFGYDNRDVTQCMLALLVLIIFLHFVSVFDFYFRFAHSTDTLKRGRPSGLSKTSKMALDAEEQDAAQHGSSTPKLSKQGSNTGGSMMNLMNSTANESGGPSGAGGNRGRFISFFLSREGLVLLYLFDVFTAWMVCFFKGEDDVSSETGSISSLVGDNSTLLENGLSFEGVDPVYVFINIVTLGLYVGQFVIQLLFLVPISSSGRRRAVLWISVWDIGSLVGLAGDAAMLIGLFVVAKNDLTLQLLFIGAVRFMRGISVYSYWQKVNSFHRVRAKQFRAIASGQAPVDYAAQNSSGDQGSMNAKVDPVAPTFGEPGPMPALSFGGPPSAPPSRGMARISGLFATPQFARPMAPPPPPTRDQNAMQGRNMDLGPQWRGFQHEFDQSNNV